MDMEEEPRKLFEKGVALVKKGRPGDAVEYLEKVLAVEPQSAACNSWLGLAIARSGGDMKRAEGLCLKAVKKDFYWPQYYHNLAQVYFTWGKKEKAIRTLEMGLKVDSTNTAILKELEKLGIRKRPVIPFLSRANPVNKYLGLVLSRLGFRS